MRRTERFVLEFFLTTSCIDKARPGMSLSLGLEVLCFSYPPCSQITIYANSSTEPVSVQYQLTPEQMHILKVNHTPARLFWLPRSLPFPHSVKFLSPRPESLRAALSISVSAAELKKWYNVSHKALYLRKFHFDPGKTGSNNHRSQIF